MSYVNSVSIKLNKKHRLVKKGEQSFTLSFLTTYSSSLLDGCWFKWKWVGGKEINIRKYMVNLNMQFWFLFVSHSWD